MLAREQKKSHFIFGLALLCLSYLGFEYFFNAYTMLSVDEFWFAHRIYEYKDKLPYRDFAPYKTVLGYYLLLIPMLSAHGIIGTLVFTKHCLATLNAVILFGSGYWLSRYFSRAAILTSLALILFSDIMLSYSSNIRVDLLSYWLCFVSLLFLLENRFALAGIFIGLGFITSQKAIWYLFASNVALGLHGLITTQNTRTLFKFAKFNLYAATTILLYVLFWSWIAGFSTVITSIFTEASIMYQLDWYASARELFWSIVLSNNPLIFLLWPLTCISLFITYRDDTSYQKRMFVVFYAFTIMLCLVPYKQVFPYYMQVTIPILFILYAAFFTWLYDLLKSPSHTTLLTNKYLIILFLLVYTISITIIITKLNLANVYYLTCLIPTMIGLNIVKNKTSTLNIVCITLIFTGLIYPLTQIIKKVIAADGSYQKYNIEALNELTQDGSRYVAGIDLLYNQSQPISGLKHLMGPAINFLYTPSAKLKPAMLASLDQDPSVTEASIIANLEKSNVKYYVNNYRMRSLPPKIRQYLTNTYTHWHASIYVYAPTVTANSRSFFIKFDGNYLLKIKNTPARTVHLTKGYHKSYTSKEYRLVFIPEPASQVTPYDIDDWEKMTL